MRLRHDKVGMLLREPQWPRVDIRLAIATAICVLL